MKSPEKMKFVNKGAFPMLLPKIKESCEEEESDEETHLIAMDLHE